MHCNNSSSLEQFIFDCIIIMVLHYCVTPLAQENECEWHQNQSIMTHSHCFSYALRQLHVTTLSFDWFTVWSASFVID